MRRLFFVALVVSLGSAGCGRPAARQKPAGQIADKTPTEAAAIQIPGTPYGNFVVGKPITHKNLTIFPISSKKPRLADRFITLDEGLKAGTVKIVEMGGGQQDPNGPEVENGDPFGEPMQEDPADSDVPVDLDRPATGPIVDPFGEANGDGATDDKLPDQNVVANDAEDDDLFGEDSSAVDPAAGVPDDAGNSEDEDAGVEPQQTDDSMEQIEQVQEDFSDQVQQIAQIASGGGSAEVNRLLVLNTSDRPLYLMPGEVISGGYQDRTIGQEIVIQPGSTPVPIEAFCVEHGRWSGRAVADATELLQTAVAASGGIAVANADETEQVDQEALEQLAEKANQGEFVASVGQLNKAARLSLRTTQSQEVVWEEVGKVNAKTGANLASGNFSGNYALGPVVKQLEPYVEACHDAVLQRPQVVGVVVAINGKVDSADVFESTPLFKKLWPKLLKSYAIDAVAASDEQQSDTPCDVVACIDFLKQVEASQVAKVEVDGNLSVARRESDSLISFTAADADAEASDAMGAADGFGGAVHTSAFSQ